MLKALSYYKDLVDSGAAPKRVATIKTYDDFNAAAQSGTTAMFLGGHWQHFQLKEAMTPEVWAKWEIAELPGPTAGRARHRHRRLDRRRLRQGPGEDQGLRLADARGLYGPGERGQRRPADPEVALRQPAEVPGPLLRPAQGIPGARPRPAGRADLPEISNQIQIMMGEVLSGAKSPEEALEGAWDRTNAAYKKG